MRTVFAALTALALIPAAAHREAWAQDAWGGDGPYASGSFAWTFNDDADIDQAGSIDRDDGWALRGALGHQYRDFRAEAELGWQRAESASGHVKAGTLMANVYYDLRNRTSFTPYVGLGAGGAWVDFDNITAPIAGRIDGDDWAFAWQAMVGVSYPVAPRMDVFGGYRYFDIGEAKVASTRRGEVDVDGLASHGIEAGLRYRF